MLQLFMGPRDRLTFRVSTGEQAYPSLGDLHIVPALYPLLMRPQDDVLVVGHDPQPDAIDSKDWHQEANSLFDPVLPMLVIISAERILATQEAFSDRSCVNVDGFWLCGAQNFFASNCHRHHLRFGISNHAQLQPNQQTNQPTD